MAQTTTTQDIPVTTETEMPASQMAPSTPDRPISGLTEEQLKAELKTLRAAARVVKKKEARSDPAARDSLRQARKAYRERMRMFAGIGKKYSKFQVELDELVRADEEAKAKATAASAPAAADAVMEEGEVKPVA